MTNLQKNSPALSPDVLRRLWFGAPIAALAVLSLVVGAALLTPMWQALQRDTRRLQELEDLVTQVSLMRQQLRAQTIQEDKALAQKDKLFRLIAGSGDVSTVLAMLDREARLSGVRLDLYEPQAAPTPPPAATGSGSAQPPPAARNQEQQAPPPNPLQMAGLQPQGMVISLRGTYPQLLDFLKRLEALNVLVIQSDLKLEAPTQTGTPQNGQPPNRQVTMKLSLSLYGKPPEALLQEAASAQADGGPGGNGAGANPGRPTAPGATTPPGGSQPAGTPGR